MSQLDLVVLVADKDIEMTLAGLLGRPQSLGIRPIAPTPLVHPMRDPGCFKDSHEFLRSQSNRFRHALVIFDREGCGQEARWTREAIELQVEDRLARNGWDNRAAAIAIDPEIEQWVWSSSPEVDRVLGWSDRNPPLRVCLEAQNLWIPGESKPNAPKAAMEYALRQARRPHSPSHFLRIAGAVSFERCTDDAFRKLKDTLRRWFAPAQ